MEITVITLDLSVDLWLICEVVIGNVCRRSWWQSSNALDALKCEWRIQLKNRKHSLLYLLYYLLLNCHQNFHFCAYYTLHNELMIMYSADVGTGSLIIAFRLSDHLSVYHVCSVTTGCLFCGKEVKDQCNWVSKNLRHKLCCNFGTDGATNWMKKLLRTYNNSSFIILVSVYLSTTGLITPENGNSQSGGLLPEERDISFQPSLSDSLVAYLYEQFKNPTDCKLNVSCE